MYNRTAYDLTTYQTITCQILYLTLKFFVFAKEDSYLIIRENESTAPDIMINVITSESKETTVMI